HADRVAETLAERSGRGFDSRRMTALGMAGRLAAPLAEPLYIIQWKIVPGEMQQAVEEHRAVTGRQHESIAIEPAGMTRMVFEESRPQHVCHRRRAKRHAWMPAVSFLNGIYREEADRVDAQLIEIV